MSFVCNAIGRNVSSMNLYIVLHMIYVNNNDKQKYFI